jgi:hypothetical protein
MMKLSRSFSMSVHATSNYAIKITHSRNNDNEEEN